MLINTPIYSLYFTENSVDYKQINKYIRSYERHYLLLFYIMKSNIHSNSKQCWIIMLTSIFMLISTISNIDARNVQAVAINKGRTEGFRQRWQSFRLALEEGYTLIALAKNRYVRSTRRSLNPFFLIRHTSHSVWCVCSVAPMLQYCYGWTKWLARWVKHVIPPFDTFMRCVQIKESALFIVLSMLSSKQNIH